MHRELDVGFDPGSPGSRPGPKAGATQGSQIYEVFKRNEVTRVSNTYKQEGDEEILATNA